MMNITPFVAPPACNKTTAPKSGHVFRPVAQSAIGTLEPVDLQDEDLTNFFYPSLPLSQAPFTTSFDADLHTVILTGEDAYKSMVADKIQTQANGQGGLSSGKNNALVMADVNEATNYSKTAKLLDLTPVLDEPVAFIASTQTFIPAPEKAKGLVRQVELLKLQDDRLKGLRQQNVLIDDLTTNTPIPAKEVVSLSEARTMIAEEQKTLPPVKALLPTLEADYWKSLLLASTPSLIGLHPLTASQCKTMSFSIEAF
ncbi:MAG: hypothetical protein H2174_03665 [Vampirovibrio sp.]|nr:hypothetical protein [Vampirovibrio sp.]